MERQPRLHSLADLCTEPQLLCRAYVAADLTRPRAILITIGNLFDQPRGARTCVSVSQCLSVTLAHYGGTIAWSE